MFHDHSNAITNSTSLGNWTTLAIVPALTILRALGNWIAGCVNITAGPANGYLIFFLDLL